MARTSVLPEAKPWIGADSFRPNRMKIGAPRPASRAGRNFAGEIAKQLGKQTADWLRAPDTECPALFHARAFSCARLRRAAPHGAYKRFAGGKALDWGGFIPPQSNENRGGTSLRRSPSSWASKPQIGFERRTLSVRRFSMPARSPAPASGGPRRMARTSVLPEAKPWIGADSFRPNRMKIGAPRPASRVGRNFAGEIAKQLGK